MLNTLSTDEGKKSFWLFNNGLTVVADSFEFSNGNLEAINPQIVNGAQTSSVLQESRAKVAEGEEQVGQHYLAYLGRPAESVAKKEEIFGDLEEADYLLKKSSSEELIALVPGLAHKVGNAPVKRQSCFGGTELYEGEVELFFSTSKGLPSHLNRAISQPKMSTVPSDRGYSSSEFQFVA
eukprot:gene23168-29361_t